MDLRLDGRTALVLAATGGLGLASAQALAFAGAKVAIVGRRGAVARREAASLAGALGIEADLTDPQSPERIVKQVTKELGQIDIAVLNSGGPPPCSAIDATDEALFDALSSVLMPAVRFVRLVVPGMRARQWGRVIAIGSSGIEQPIPGLATSNAARAALAGYLKTLAGEVAAQGVTVNILIPGRFATERVAGLDLARATERGFSADRARQESEASIPAQRYGQPTELASVAAFLASDAASYLTGSLVRVDGGYIRTTH